MTIKQQLIALYTLLRREFIRMFRIASQVFLPPMITTALYFLIFGTLIGQRIGPVDGVSYALFIAPGLIMMSVITNAYGNVSTSLFSMRFQRSIDELLISPMSNGLILLGYILGGIMRGVLVALLVAFVSSFFVSFDFHHLGLGFLVIVMASAIFSLAGFTNAMFASTFDDVMIIPTFVLTPLTYLGGVFYTTSMLSPFWQTVSQCNPIFYIVSALRTAMIGHETVSLSLSLGMMAVFLLGLTILNLSLLHRGVGLRE